MTFTAFKAATKVRMFRDIVVELELIKSEYSSDAGTNSTALSSGAPSPQLVRHTIPALARHETVACPQYQVRQ